MPDYRASANSVIRQLLTERDALEADLLHREVQFLAYAQQPAVVATYTAVSPEDHYNMLDEGLCGCSACADWDLRRLEFLRATKLLPKDHKWTVCACSVCRFVGRFQLNLLAAANRRDLLIEMSFHARYHSHHGKLIMDWLAAEMRNPAYTINWCAQEMSRYPMERWLQRCELAVSGLVGGPVFVNSAKRIDAIVSIGSSLATEGATYSLG